MISIEEAKRLLNDPSLSDEEVKEIRDNCYVLAAFVLHDLED